jgi:hypothetical protein
MSLQLNGDTGVTFNDASLQGAAASPFGLKNRIINGDMVIDQRNNGALVAGAAGEIYGVDRFVTGVFSSGTGRISAQQSSTTPTGFVKSLINTVTTADAAPSANFGYCVTQRIEGYNTADLRWGTASPQTVTVSFWVRNSIAGTYCITLANEAVTWAYTTTYTVSSANTWEQKTVTFTGPTSGTWLTTNGAGIVLVFGLGGGSNRQATLNAWYAPTSTNTPTDASGCVDWIATNGATFYITGVQLERNTTATPFEWLPYGTELALCQRYFVGIKNDGVNNLLVAPTGVATSTADVACMLPLLVEMRTQPSISGTSLAVADAINPISNVTSVTIRTDISTTKGIYFGASGASGLTTYRLYYVRFQAASSGSFNISAEL